MFKRLTVTALVFGMAALAPPMASAQAKCGPRDAFVEKLADRYKEVSKGVGLSSSTQVVEFWMSEETGTFSILMTYPNGMTCLIAAGRDWTASMAEPARLDKAL